MTRFRAPFAVTLLAFLAASFSPHADAQSERGGPAVQVRREDEDSGLSRRVERLRRDRLLREQLEREAEAGRSGEVRRNPTPVPPLTQRYPAAQIVVGVVGDHVLTLAELRRMADPNNMVPDVSEASLDPDDFEGLEALRKVRRQESRMLEDWAVTKVLYERAKREGIKVSDEEVDAALKEIEEEMTLSPAAAEALGGGSRRPGATFEESRLREQLREGLMVDKILKRQVLEMVPEEDLQAIYRRAPGRYMTPEQRHVYEIFFRVSDEMPDSVVQDKWAELHDLAKDLRGEDLEEFREVARKESDPPRDAKGGDMGWIAEGTQLDEELARALRRLKPGEISDVVRTKIGLHVLFLGDVRQATGATWDADARERVLHEVMLAFRRNPAILKEAPVQVVLNAGGIRPTDNATPLPDASR